MNCMKHPLIWATTVLQVGNQKYTLCAECSSKALDAGNELTCIRTGKKIKKEEQKI